jgi:hypothetical protein
MDDKKILVLGTMDGDIGVDFIGTNVIHACKLFGPISSILVYPHDRDFLLFAVNVIGLCRYFKDIRNNGFNQMDSHILPKSTEFDSLLCSALVREWDSDGNGGSILLGSYGKQILVYSSKSFEFKGCYSMLYPIYGIHSSYDEYGLPCLLVLSHQGIHLLQKINLKETAKKLILSQLENNNLLS